MYKGHLLMPNMNVSAGVVLLVALARANGGSERNIDPGFAAAAKVRQNAITLWTSHDQVATMLSQGTAWVAVESVDRLGPLNRSGAPIDIDYPEDGVVAVGNSMGISAGTRHKKAGGGVPQLFARPRAGGTAQQRRGLFPARPRRAHLSAAVALLPAVRDEEGDRARLGGDCSAVGCVAGALEQGDREVSTRGRRPNFADDEGAVDVRDPVQPAQIGPVTVRNRVMHLATRTLLHDRNQVSDRLIAFFEERVRGGVGSIVLSRPGPPRATRSPWRTGATPFRGCACWPTRCTAAGCRSSDS